MHAGAARRVAVEAQVHARRRARGGRAAHGPAARDRCVPGGGGVLLRRTHRRSGVTVENINKALVVCADASDQLRPVRQPDAPGARMLACCGGVFCLCFPVCTRA